MTAFVTRSGANLQVSGVNKRFTGSNIYWMGLAEVDPNGNLNPHYPTTTEVDDAIATAVEMGATVVRCHTLGISYGNSLSVWPTLNNTNTAAFTSIDYAIYKCGLAGLRLIIPLVDNYHYYHGGKHTFTDWRGISDETQFYTNATVIADFKAYLNVLLNRVNQYNSLAYKNDPTILAWETGNELDNPLPGPTWTTSIANYLKTTLGAQQLVMDGSARIDTSALTITTVDMYTVHYYPPSVSAITSDASTVTAQSKVFWSGEFSWLNTVGGTGTGSIDSTTSAGGAAQSVKIVVTQPATSDFFVQLLQQGTFGMTTGHTYTVSYYAKSLASYTVTCGIQQNSGGYNVYAQQQNTFTPSWAQYSFTFTAGTTDSNLLIFFNLGLAATTTWIAAVSVSDNANGTNLLSNPNFTGGTIAPWTVSNKTFDTLGNFLSTIEGNANISGDAFWNMQPHDDTNGFVLHLDGYSVYYPDGQSADDQTRFQQLRTHAWLMQGYTSSTIPAPGNVAAPLITGINGNAVSWRGVAGARNYTLESSPSGATGTFTAIASHVTDFNTPITDPNYTSSTSYRVRAYNYAGIAGPYSPVYGGTTGAASNVATSILTNLWTHAWNPLATTKQANGTYPTTGAMYINWDQNINWSTYDPFFDVNQAAISASSTLLNYGGNTLNLHDPQVELQYLRCIALYKAIYGGTQYDNNNAQGVMGVSAMVNHVMTDFQPTTTSVSGYNNPKGWVYFALLDIYLNLKNSPLLSAQQVTNMQQACLYAAWTYYNSYYDSVNGLLASNGKYQVAQSLLMSAALLDAATRFSSQIVPGMFYLSHGTDTNSPANWQNAAISNVTAVNTRGAWSSTYNLYNGYMAVVNGGPDTVLDAQGKVGDEAEAAQALIRLYNATGTSSYLTQANTLLQSIESKCWDTTNGGYYFAYYLNGAGVSNAYKECRAQAHMLYAYNLYDAINPTYTTNEAAIGGILNNHMYKSTNGGGFFYRTTADANFAAYPTHYAAPWSSTLVQQANAGTMSVVVKDIVGPPALPTGANIDLTLDPHVAGVEEQWAFSLPPTGTGPYTIALNPNARGGAGLANTHAAGAIITALSYPTDNLEDEYTTEAMTGTVVYLLATQIGTNNGVGVSTQTVTLTATAGGANPAPQSVSVTNNTGLSGTLATTITYGSTGGWLAITPGNGTLANGGSAAQSFVPTLGTLVAGTYTATVTFTIGTSTAIVNVTLTVAAASGAVVMVAPTSLSFTGVNGGANPASQNVTVNNTGTASGTFTTSITYTSGSGWLALSPTTATIGSGGNTTVAVSVASTSLGAGSYSATITYTMNGTTATTTVTVAVTGSGGGGGGGTITPLAVYLANATSTTLATADQLYTTAASGTITVATPKSQLDTATGYGELTAKGTTSAWAGLASLGAPTGKGFFLDVDSVLATKQLAAGNYSAVLRLGLNTTGGATADCYVRVYKYSGGVYSQIVTLSLTGQTFTNNTQSNYTFGAVAGAAVAFATGDRLYVDIWLNIKTNTSAVGQSIRLNNVSTDTTGLTGSPYATLSTPGTQSSGSGTPLFVASPTSLSFTGTLNAPAPSAQSVTLTNATGASATVTTSVAYSPASVSWLTVAPGNDTIANGGTATEGVSCSLTGLSAGVYTATITFAIAGNTATVNVVLTVNAATVTAQKAVVTNVGLNVLRDALGNASKPAITFVALGTSNVAPTPNDTTLGAEVFRKAVTSYTNSATGQIFINMYLAPGDALNANIQEVGLFAGNATAAANTGTLVVHGLYVHTPKSARESIQFQLNVQFLQQ